MNSSQLINDKIDDLINKYEALKKREKMDLSSDQDLTIAIMNLISIEEHFFFSGAKTGKNEYFDLIKEIKDIRKELLKKIITEHDGELWCISKHLLAASYRLMEAGTKQLELNKKEESYNFFTKAYNLYSLFWGLIMKIIPISSLNNNRTLSKKYTCDIGIMSKFSKMVRKIIDCCIE
ncbi:MAG: hypothetical protein LBL40_01240 [Coxiellaceae bacterium]|jgi:hypothetical protein|nr:hypothetical protein [Coxiellaceae bacterium]